MDDDDEWFFWKILWKWMIIIQDDTGKNAFDINICWATQLFQMKSNEQQLRHPSMNACDVWKSLMLYTRNWVLNLLEEAKKKHTVFWSVESWCFSTCFNHQTLKYWEKPMFQHVSTCFPNVSIIFSNQWENHGEFFRVVPQILYSGLFVRFAWAVQPRNYILASCPETQRFSLEKFHGATSNSWFLFGGKMMMKPIFVGENPFLWCTY